MHSAKQLEQKVNLVVFLSNVAIKQSLEAS